MTLDELNRLLAEAADPTKAPEALIKIKEGYESLFNDLITASKAHDEDQAKIANLTDTNQRLFLRVTGATIPPDQDDEQKQIRDMTPEERDAYMADLINKKEE